MSTLRASNIQVILADGRCLFDNISLTVTNTTSLVISGPSGCGKSTLLRQLALLDDATSAITLDDETPTQIGVPLWRSRVCYVGQAFVGTVGRTPQEYWSTVASLHCQRCRHDGLKAAYTPEELDPRVIASHWALDPAKFDQSWSELSGGEAQRAGLAVAVSFRPDILLLDECCSALDDDSKLLVERTLVEHSNIGLVWVTHDMAQRQRVATDTIEF